MVAGTGYGRKWDAGAPAAQLLLCQGNLWRPSKELRRAFQGMIGRNWGGGEGELVEGQKVSHMQ